MNNNTMPLKSSDRSLNELNKLRCTKEDILRILKYCPNTAAGPYGFSFALIKELIKFIIYPLTIIFQNLLFQGKFPSLWKLTYLKPIYKGKGDTCNPASYRPINQCSCFDKLLERLVKEQLFVHINLNYPLHEA